MTVYLTAAGREFMSFIFVLTLVIYNLDESNIFTRFTPVFRITSSLEQDLKALPDNYIILIGIEYDTRKYCTS